MSYRCECKPRRWFSEDRDLMNHVRGAHTVEVTKGSDYSPHWGYCNSCTKSNGHGYRLSDFSMLQRHLKTYHDLYVSNENNDPIMRQKQDEKEGFLPWCY